MAKQRKFKCAKCDRRFSMAAHLGRHMSMTHGPKKIKATKTKKRAIAQTGRPVSKGFGGVLDSLRAHRDQLSAQRTEIDNQVQALDRALAALGAGTAKPVAARRKPGKGSRAGSLKDYIGRVLRGLVKGKSVKDIAVAVKKAGYKTKSKTLGHAIGKALTDMKNVVRVGRGVYRLK